MKPISVTAFCPGHISGYFRSVKGKTVDTTGSIGAGIVISEGVTATVSAADSIAVEIQCRDSRGAWQRSAAGSSLLHDALEGLGCAASVTTRCVLPIGAGFGLSAAALLATLTAVNRVLDLGMRPDRIAEYAHATEVKHRTGLGDVAACQGGGRVTRFGPGVHGRIERSFDADGPICAVSFGPILTPSILDSPERMDRVAAAFPERNPETIADFFTLSRSFAEKSGLVTPEVRRVLRRCDAAGILSSMTMLGNGVFACGGGAEDLLRPFEPVYRFSVAGSGVRIVGDTP